MQKHFVTYKSSVICFGLAGSGEHLLVCFHGFGEDCESFTVLEPLLGELYTIVAVEFPFHGQTQWNEGLLMKPEDLLNIIDLIFKEADCEQPVFSMLGYSLGGRIALQLAELVPEKTERLVLLAPDGLKVNFWYWIATQTFLGNKLFYVTMQNPAWILWMVHIAHKMGLLNKSIMKFVEYYLNDKAVRQLLYRRWTTMRKFKPDIELVIKNMARFKIPVRFVFGSYDRIILSKRSDHFKADTENVKILILQAGHQLLKEKNAKEIAALFC